MLKNLRSRALAALGKLSGLFSKPKVAKFWRVLDDAPIPPTETEASKPNPHSPKKRWDKAKYNANHQYPPGEWKEEAKKPEGERVYSLSCIDGLRTQEALDAFKVAVEEQGNEEAWLKEIRIAVGELDGTVAWETPIKAWEYVLGQADGEITPEILDQSYVVEFEGVNLGKPIPEGLGGGRQVKVTDPGRIIFARQFAKENGYEIPFEREPKPFEDSAEYEDE